MTHSRMDLDIHHLAIFESFPYGRDLSYNDIGMHYSIKSQILMMKPIDSVYDLICILSDVGSFDQG